MQNKSSVYTTEKVNTDKEKHLKDIKACKKEVRKIRKAICSSDSVPQIVELTNSFIHAVSLLDSAYTSFKDFEAQYLHSDTNSN